MTETTTTPAAEGETPAAATGITSEQIAAKAAAAEGGMKVTVSNTGDEHDPIRAKALIDKLREKEKEGERAAKALRDAQAKLDAIDAEKLSESERLQKERDDATAKATDAETRLREQAIRLAVYGQKDALGLASADLAISALDRSAVTFDDQGQPTNVADLLTALIEREPILKGTPAKPVIPSTDGGAGGGTTAPSLTSDELEAARIGGMTPEQYQAAKSRLGNGAVVNVIDAAAALTKKG